MVKLYNGDCIEIMKDIPDRSVDLILCDLPYGTTKCSWDIIIPFDELWKQYKRIIKDASKFLTERGQIFFEIGCEQAADVSALLLQNGFEQIRVIKDLAGLDRVVSATLV